MVTTYRYIVYSVLEAIKESKDDSEIKRNTVIFWTQVVVNSLREQRLAKRHIQSGAFLAMVGGIQVLQSGKRKYFVAPSDIVDLENDNGIRQITYELADFDYCDTPMRVPFNKTSPEKVWSLINIPVRKPTPTRAYYAREGFNVYLYGIDNVNVQTVDMWFYAAVTPVHLLNLDAPIELAEGQMEVLINRVMALARFAMLFPNDRTNIGGDLNIQAGRNKTALSQVPIGSQMAQAQNDQANQGE